MNELQDLEQVIESGLKGFRDVGPALARIRTRKLYRGSDASWEAYCRRRWGFSRRHADRLIAAAAFVRQLKLAAPALQDGQETGPTGPASFPSSERQVRELVTMGPGRRQVLVEQLRQTDQPTAAQLAEMRQGLDGESREDKLAGAQAAEQQGLQALSNLMADRVKDKIERLADRARKLHRTLPAIAAAADEKLNDYLGVVRAA